MFIIDSDFVIEFLGPLGAVSNIMLASDSQRISWIPPIHLDLTNVNTDILYCFFLYNITCGNNELVVDDCSLDENNYPLEDILVNSLLYQYQIIPRNNVENAINGTPTSLIGMICMYIIIPLSYTMNLMSGLTSRRCTQDLVICSAVHSQHHII